MDTSGRSRNKSTKPANLALPPHLDKVKLADGKEYALAPLDLNMLCEFEDAYPDKDAADLIASGKLKYIRHLIWLRLRVNSPDITLEQLGRLITLDTLLEIRKQIGV